MSISTLSSSLEEGLQLDVKPVGVAFVKEPPPNVKTFDSTVPSTCSLWRQAETSVFYAPANQHFNCAIGAMVMGFDLPDDVKAEIPTLVGSMCECNYIESSEAEHIPVMESAAAGIVYGPASDLPVTPDLLLLWLTPKQAMIYSEAAGNAKWMQDAPSHSTLGRPACAAIPAALKKGATTMSLGCIGMRTFTEIGDTRVLAVLPTAIADEFLPKFQECLEANRLMSKFYEKRKIEVLEVSA